MSHFGSSGPPDIRDTHSLLVLNITFRTSADDLYPLFDRYGKVVDIFIPRDRRTGESRGFAFVRYKYAEEAQKAIERLDGRNVDGRDMVVQYAKYGRDMETIHRGKITQGSPSKWSRSRSRSPRRSSRPRSPIRGGRRNFGPPSHSYPSPPRGRDRYQAAPPPSGRHRDEYRERDYRHRSRSRDRYERSDRYRDREREREHRRRSPSRSASRSRSRSQGRAYELEHGRSHGKVAERDISPRARSPSRGRSPSRSISRSPSLRRSAEPVNEGAGNGELSPRETKRNSRSMSPKRDSLSPDVQHRSPVAKSLSPVGRESLSPARSVSPDRSISPMQRSASRSPSPRCNPSLTPERLGPDED